MQIKIHNLLLACFVMLFCFAFLFVSAFLFAEQPEIEIIENIAEESDEVFGPLTEEMTLLMEKAALQEHSSFLEDDLSQRFLNPYKSIMMNSDVVAFYGHPNAAAMGIIGQYSLEELEPLLLDFAASYDAVNGVRTVTPALYLIFGTCWPEGEIGYLNSETCKKYINYAAERGWLVFLDHQIGKYTVEYAVQRLLPYLQYENIHLALDPEWRTTKPMQEIGWVTADEVNNAQQMIEDYLIENNLPGKRMLVIHQFKPWMISRRPEVRSNFARVNLVHCADGFGTPAQKRDSYAANAQAENIPLKSFKLFTRPVIAGAGFDSPMMTPEEVLSLQPRPYLIMLQ
jgi:hemolysin-activating ACP:hemolysin acyltransferase